MAYFFNWFSCKDNNTINNEKIVNTIIQKMKEKNLNVDDINYATIYYILDDLSFTERLYKSHISSIFYDITGKKNLFISKENLDKITGLYETIQDSKIIYCPYSDHIFNIYFLYKIAELLELDDFIEYYEITLDVQTITYLDCCWQKICNHNQFQFIPTL